MSEFTLFLKQVLNNPRQMGSVAPSSQKLGIRMAESVPDTEGNIVEFGAGTGKITTALLEVGVNIDTIHSFEVNANLVEHLKKRFPNLKVYQDRAENLGLYNINQIKAVVSGLPLLSMNQATQRSIVTEAFKNLQPSGLYIQFTYGLFPPIAKSIREDLSLGWTRSERIWGNLPPATSYVFYRRTSA